MAQKLAKSRKKVQYKLHQLYFMPVLLFSGRFFCLSFYFVLFSASSKFLFVFFFKIISEPPYKLTFLRNQLPGWPFFVAYH